MEHQTHIFQFLHAKFLYFFLIVLSFNGLHAQDWQEVLDAAASDGASSDLFGNSVAIDGDYAIVGAFSEDNKGAAYIFERSGGTWSEVQKIVASDKATFDNFGASVAISGDYAIVGARDEEHDEGGANELNDAGSAYIFERSGSTWSEVQKIVASDRAADDLFGYSVAISGDYAIVGAYQEDEDVAGTNPLSSAGSAYIFERSGGTWSEVQKIVASDRAADDDFGRSVSISGVYAIIGAYGEDEDASGANTLISPGSAYIFERSGGTWTQMQKIVASDRASVDNFGYSVAISGDYVIVGAYLEYHDAAGANSVFRAGSAYIFEQSGGTWTQMQKIVASDRAANDYFGYSVAISGEYAIVGAYQEDEDAAGANTLSSAGSAYVFEQCGGTWSEKQKIVASDRAIDDDFGWFVAISDNQALVGAYQKNSSQGKAYFFQGPQVFPHGGYALEFDGTNDYVDCGDDASVDISGSSLTLEAWIYPTAWAANYYEGSVVVKEQPNSGYMLRVGENGRADFHLGNGSSEFGATTGTGVLALNEWQHLAAVLDGTSMALYVNGVSVATQTFSGTIGSHSDSLFIGSSGLSTRLFTGKIDEVRVWDDARTLAEIQANMNKELSGEESNLAAYYPISNANGSTLRDYSCNSNIGDLKNSPTWKTSGALAGSDMALDFDGSDDYVYGSLNATATSSLTIEGWVSFNSLTAQQNLFRIHQTGANTIRIVPYKTAANVISFYIFDGSLTYTVNSTFSISQINTWNHLAFVYDAGSVSIYANGNLVGSASSQGNFSLAATNQITIGADSDGISESLFSHAKIDEVRVWGDARTEVEIRANKDHILRGDEDDLLAYYRFDQQADAGNTTLYDLTANANHGTLNNMDGATDWVSSDPFNTWIGSEDSDWNNAENWSRGSVPSTEDVGIFAWDGNNLPATANISARNFYVDAGASLSHSGNLTLSGNFYNEGTFTHTGNITFSGSSAQAIQGSGTSTFGTLTLNNAAGLTMEQSFTVNTSLVLTSGILTLNSFDLSLGTGASISGTPSNSNHINAGAGVVLKNYSGTGSFSFPVGDGLIYSPISLNFTSGSFSSGSASVNVALGKHPNNSSASDYLDRYWTVTSSGISSFSCDVTASYDDTDINGTEGDMVGGKWDGSSWTDLGAVTEGSNLITGTVSSFSDFTAGEPTAFPVEWLDFQAKFTEKEQVQLDWITASELNSDFFAVERSHIQGQWTQLGRVQSAGNSSGTTEYRYIDTKPLRGKTYYRLRQVDVDGAFDYSATVEISWEDHPILIYPNPVSDILTLELPENSGRKLKILDIHGRVVLKAKLTSGKQTLSLGSLSPGRYILLFKDHKGSRQEFQLVKE